MKTGNMKRTIFILILSVILIVSAVLGIFFYKKNDNTADKIHKTSDDYSIAENDPEAKTENILNDYTNSEEIQKAVTDSENKDAVNTAQNYSEKYADKIHETSDDYSIAEKDLETKTENILNDYTNSEEIQKAVTDPENKDAVSTARNYSKKYADEIPEIESIYTSLWDTSEVIAHNNEKYIGIRPRRPDSLTDLQNTLTEAGTGIYNAGIITSPLTGVQLLTMYKIVFDNNNVPVGYTGISMKTESLPQDY